MFDGDSGTAVARTVLNMDLLVVFTIFPNTKSPTARQSVERKHKKLCGGCREIDEAFDTKCGPIHFVDCDQKEISIAANSMQSALVFFSGVVYATHHLIA